MHDYLRLFWMKRLNLDEQDRTYTRQIRNLALGIVSMAIGFRFSLAHLKQKTNNFESMKPPAVAKFVRTATRYNGILVQFMLFYPLFL
jgi:hypothetical protein